MRQVATGAMTLASLVLIHMSVGETARQSPDRTISEIMLKAHQPGRSAKRALDQRVILGTASTMEKAELVTLYEELSRATPPAGSLDDWKKDTGALVDAAKAVQRGNAGASERLSRALDCAACHRKYRDPALLEVAPREPAYVIYFKENPPPDFARIIEVDRENEMIRLAYVRHEFHIAHKEVEVVVAVDGKPTSRKERVPEFTTRPVPAEVQLRLKEIRILDAKGQELDAGGRWKRLTVGQMVVRQPGRRPIAQEYLDLLRGDAVVLTPR